MSAILSDMKTALMGQQGGGDPQAYLDQLRANPNVQSAGVSQYMAPHIRQNLFLPEPGTPGFFGQHPAFAQGLENAMIGVGQMSEIPRTTGQGISMVAQGLMAGPMAHRQWQMQQVMMPFQIAQQMAGIREAQGKGEEALAHGRFFDANANWTDNGRVTTQNRNLNTETPQLFSDPTGKQIWVKPGENPPDGFHQVQKQAQAGPYGNTALGQIISRMQGNHPSQSPALMSDQDKAISQSLAAQALGKMNDYEKSIASARASATNNAPGGPVDRQQQGEIATAGGKIHQDRVTNIQKQLDDLSTPKGQMAAAMGQANPEQFVAQQRQQLQTALDNEHHQYMNSTMTGDYSPYLTDIAQSVVNGTHKVSEFQPPSPMAPAMGAAPQQAAPQQAAPQASPAAPQAASPAGLSPAGTAYMNSVFGPGK